MTEEQKQSIGRALGRIVSGVYILTAEYRGQAAAMMASWVMQSGFEPPMVTLAIAKGRPITEIIRPSGRMGLSIISETDKTLMKHYARMRADDDPFEGVNIKPAPSSVPVLSDALGWLDLRLRQYIDIGADHELYIGEVMAAQMPQDGKAFAHQRGNGFHY